MVKIICQDEQKQAQEIFNEIQPKFDEIIVVSDQTDIDRFMAEIKFLKDKKKLLEEKRKSITGPLDEAKKNTQALFNPMRMAIDEAVNIRESGILIYRRRKEEEARAAEEKLRASQPKPKDELEEMDQQADIAKVNAGKAQVKGVTKYYSMEIVDAEKVPRIYLIPDEKGLNGIARVQKEKFKVPGCRLIIKEIIK
ncbi:hypothetical protein CMI41_00025 [Candidatus Pacearchaeota archaeon]|jgi:hypothetical protein|nr:hypothetical protein [Candidatus Pacearchaeota archaeon]|tara:strand:+ start:6440 stop:7027 length:588 start_codon:yes stop_codon:yes gene_type:complete